MARRSCRRPGGRPARTRSPEGFELIANTAEDVRDVARTLPRAFYQAVGFVIVLYVLVSLVTLGNLPVDKIAAAENYALSEAAGAHRHS